MIRYLTRDEVLEIHRWSLQAFGGLDGILHPGMLDSAIAQPQGSFGGQEFYPTVFEKAAALGFALVKNHPFQDGNKRTGIWAMATFLRLNGQGLGCDTDDGEQAVLAVASGKWGREELTAWIGEHCQPLQGTGSDGGS